MIEKVRTIWITGFLEQWLFQQSRVILGLSERPDAVVRPLNLLVQRPDQGERPLPSGSQVVDVYDTMDRTLLILGAPGSGKTTLLLEVARDLLTRATHDSAHPIPVVFPLSTWSESRKPLVEWLKDELNLRYDVPTGIAQEWVAADQILPLLDGLDEVRAEHRPACVEAVNAFRQSHGFLPVVITSRLADYDTLAKPLRLHGAVLVRPLTREQVNAYLADLGSAGEPIRAAIKGDPSLWELLDNPLLLNIVSVAYASQEGPPRVSGTMPERRDHLFESYVNQMLRRRGADPCYTADQTGHWLTWMAHQMDSHGHAVFYLERLQLDWLPPMQQLIVLICYALGVSLFGGLVCGLGVGMGVVLVCGQFFGLGVGLRFGRNFGLIVGLGGATGVLMGFGLKSIKNYDIISVDEVNWLWSRFRHGVSDAMLGRPVRGLIGGLVCGLYGGYLFGSLGGIFFGMLGMLYGGLYGGLFFGLGGCLSVALFVGMEAGLTVSEIETKADPNAGIRRSARNALRMALVGGLIFGLIFALFFGLFFGLGVWLFLGPLGGRAGWTVGGLVGGVFFGLVGGLFFGLFFGLRAGGDTYLKHIVLRFWLIRNGSTPRNYVKFLDYAADRILLRKVGGGYMFIHRMLLEYFAARYVDPSVAGTPRLSPPATEDAS